MKKLKLLIPFAVFGLMLSSCSDPTALAKNYTSDDLNIDTPWTDYYLPATSVEFEDGEESLSLNKGDVHSYRYSLSPKGATTNSLVWDSDAKSVATVESGVVTAVGAGEATITASSPDDSFDPVELYVSVNVPLTDFTVSVPEKFDWEVEQKLEVTYEPSDTTYKDLVFEIVNPSVEGLLEIEQDGTITTERKNGTATLKVYSPYLGEEHAKTYNIVVETVPISSFTLAYHDSSITSNKLEVDSTLAFKTTILPEDASDYVKYGVRYYSDDESVLTIDPVTGVATGVNDGTANVYAKCKDATSNLMEIEVYTATVTSISEAVIDHPVLSNNGSEDNPLSGQLTYKVNYTSPAGSGSATNTAPKRWNITYEAEDPDIVDIDANGLVTAKNPGSTNVKIKVANGSDLVEESVAVSVFMVSKSINVSGSSFTLYTDSELELTATITPANVSDDTIVWSAEPSGVVTLTPNGNKVTVASVDDELDEPKSVTITASNEAVAHGGVAGTYELTVREREVAFEPGAMYIVGSAAFNTKESQSGHTSWYTPDGSNPRAARYAYKFVDECYDPTVTNQYKATIKLNAGDEFRYFVGADYYVPYFEKGYDEYEQEWTGYHIQHTEGAFLTEKLALKDATDANTNIVVNETGYYDFYAKRYAKADSNDWYGLYICETPAIEVEIANATMGLTDSFTIKPVNAIGVVSYTVSENTASAEVDIVNGVITATGAEGKVVVSVNDSRNGTPVVVTVNIVDGASGVSKVIYINGNGHANQDDAKLFAHTWAEGSSTILPRDTQFTLVSGQNIVYSISIPVEHNMIVIVRESPIATQIVWEGEYFWGQTEDLNIPTDGKDMYVSTGYKTVGEGTDAREYLSGSWDIFDPNTIYDVEAVFEKDKPYIIGSNDFSTGTSVTGTGWSLAESFKVVDTEDDPAYFAQFVADITFQEDDEWRGLVGNGTSVVDGDQGWIENVQSTEGAFAGANPQMTLLSNNNIKVNVEGTYHICIKVLLDNGGWQIYVAPNGEPTPPTPSDVFELNKPYIIGSSDYSTGTSVDGTGWTLADSLKVTDTEEDPSYFAQFVADVTFREGDLWRGLVGNGTAVVDENQGWISNVQSTIGAFATEPAQMEMDGDNIQVNVAGTYHICIKVLLNDGGWQIYVAPKSTPTPPAPSGDFKANTAYIVGDHSYASRTSAEGASWEDAEKAFEFTSAYEIDPTQEESEYLDSLYKASITFAEDDVWAINVGGTVYDCVEIAGAFGTADQMAKNDQNKYVVKEAGEYDVYMKFYKNGSYGCYVDDIDEPTPPTPVDPDNITIYFTNNWYWVNVNAYAFKGETPEAVWPGTAMVRVGMNGDYDDVYSFTVDKNSFDTLIINNGLGGDSNQTVDIDLSQAETNDAYYLSGRVDSDESKKATVGTWTFDESELVDETRYKNYYFTNNWNWSDVRVHVFKGTTSKSTWPGDAMKHICKNSNNEDVYRVTVDTQLYDTVIFNGISPITSAREQTANIALSTFGAHNACYISGGTSPNCTVGYWDYPDQL